MKSIIVILAPALALTSCGLIRPAPRNGGPNDTRKHDRKPFIVQQWTRQLADSTYLVTTIRSNRTRSDKVFECMPDSAQLAGL